MRKKRRSEPPALKVRQRRGPQRLVNDAGVGLLSNGFCRGHQRFLSLALRRDWALQFAFLCERFSVKPSQRKRVGLGDSQHVAIIPLAEQNKRFLFGFVSKCLTQMILRAKFFSARSLPFR
ncbi:MAG: hypothetical protein ACREJD_05510 [Phycisphaerales bacterium]